MAQAPHESVDQFAFRFKNILHQLEKMGENLAEQCPNYVVSQFVSKVQAQLTPHLTMRSSEFKSLDAAIEAAHRTEKLIFPESTNRVKTICKLGRPANQLYRFSYSS